MSLDPAAATQAVARAVFPPSCNTGGTQPPTQGNNPAKPGPPAQKTIIDTISWTIPDQDAPTADDDASASSGVKRSGVKAILGVVLGFFPEGCEWTAVGKGQHGYPYQTQLVCNSLVLGWLAFGAQHGKHWLYLTGTGLRHRRDNKLTDDSLAMLGDLPGARLGRVDIALDLYDHATFSVNASITAHAKGCYKLPNAPSSPHSELFQSDTKSDDYAVARTHYLGKRSASKRLRVYDKGLQLLGSLTSEDLAVYKTRGIVRADPTPDLCRLEEWTRVELIYKHDKVRPLHADMIIRRDDYFAGAYPLLRDLLKMSDGARPSYVPKDEDCELARMIEAGRGSYGGLIYFMRHERSLSDADIISELIGTKSAARLMVDKERPQ